MDAQRALSPTLLGAPTNGPGRAQRAGLLAGALVFASVIAPFFVATTFIGDDHLFLAFARYEPKPWAAFVADRHGGEYYRPIPMLLWWVLGRLAPGSTWPFALLALALHSLIAWQARALILAVQRDTRIATTAATLFFVSPFARESAYWYSASTDLLAATFMLGALLACLRGRALGAVFFAGAACWCKETAIVLPILAFIVLLAGRPRDAAGWGSAAATAARLLAPVLLYVSARFLVLRGIGGAADSPAPLFAKLVQIISGLVHAPIGSEILPDGLAWPVGIVAWAALLVALARSARGTSHARHVLANDLAVPLAWIAVTLAPLLASPWIVGARYFYLPLLGVAWLAALALRGRLPLTIGILAGQMGLGLLQDVQRRSDVKSYEARVAAARELISSSIGRGHRIFHVDGRIKDLDLVIKADPRLDDPALGLIVIPDVPSSFVVVPRRLRPELDFLWAQPPLPPSGAYRFGDRRIVGLVRRGAEPTLEEVLTRVPDIRFLRLLPGQGPSVVYRDVTADVRATVD